MSRLAFLTIADARAAIPEIIRHLRNDGVLAYPTETVYGFGGLLTPTAVDRLAELKTRDESKPFLLLISDPEQSPDLEWTPAARALARHFWPGPLTLALRTAADDLHARVISHERTVAVRETPHTELRLLLDALGEPITSSSANLPHQAPAGSADHAEAIISELGAADVLLLDGGVLPASASSTLVDCSVDPPRIIRQGAIAEQSIRKVLES